MQKKLKTILKTALLASTLCLQSIPLNNLAAANIGEKIEAEFNEVSTAITNKIVLQAQAATTHSGTWGTCKWDIVDGVLTIHSGTGTNPAGADSVPWAEYRSQITKVKTDGTVVLPSVPWYLFYKCTNLTVFDAAGFDAANVVNYTGMFQDCSNLKELDLSGWSTANTDITSFNNTFMGCKSLVTLKLPAWDTSNVEWMTSTFTNCEKLKSVNLSTWTTPNVKSIYGIFSGCMSLNTDISDVVCNWDTSNMFSTAQAFNACHSLTKLDLSKWNTSHVTDMNWMFANCLTLSNLDISGFDTSSVSNMDHMFYNCAALPSIKLDASLFNTSNVTNMEGMFMWCGKLAALDVSKFNTSKVTTMKSMFDGCSTLTSLNVSNFKTGNVTTMESMFNNCSALTALDVSGFDTSKTTNMKNMFKSCTGLQTVDISNFKTGNVTTMESMFDNCSALTALDVSGLNTGNVTNMNRMFNNCKKISSLDIAHFDTSNVTTMESMFAGSGITDINLTTWKTSKVTNMSSMFSFCQSLVNVNMDGCNTGSVTTMFAMFSNATAIKNLNFAIVDSSKVKTFEYTFCTCSSLETLDLSTLDTSGATTMRYMFSNDPKLKTANVSSFKTGNVTNMQGMFGSCGSLQTVDVKGFDTKNVTTMQGMFYGDIALQNIDASDWDVSKVKDMSMLFHFCESITSLNLSGWNTASLQKASQLFPSGANIPAKLTYLNISNFDTRNVSDSSSMFNCPNLNTVAFGKNWTLKLSSVGFPTQHTDWLKVRDADGTLTKDFNQYSLAANSYVNKNTAYVAADSASQNTATDPVLAGTWRIAANVKDDYANGAEDYVSENVVSGSSADKDNDTDDEWVKEGNVWKYTFRVFDDTLKYKVYEENMDGYKSEYMYPNGYGIVDDSKSFTIKNTTEKSALTITKTLKCDTAAMNTMFGQPWSDVDSLPASIKAQLNSTQFPISITLTSTAGIEGMNEYPAVYSAINGGTTDRAGTSTVVFVDGKATVYLKRNEQVAISDLPAGVQYKVEEKSQEGFKPDYSGGDTHDSSSVTGTLDANKTEAVNITNSWTPTVNGRDIVVKKALTGRYTTVPDTAFSFTASFDGLTASALYYASESNGSSLTFTADSNGASSVAFSLKANETITFENIPVGATYQIQENAGKYIPSYQIETNKAVAKSSAAASENASLTTARETVDDEENATVTFTNEIHETQSLTLTKKMGEDVKDTSSSFDFTIIFANLHQGDSITSSIGRFIVDPDNVLTPDLMATYGITDTTAQDTLYAVKDFAMKAGDSIVFSNIPVGTKYTVIEKANVYRPSYTVTGTTVVSASGAPASNTSYDQFGTALETVDTGENGVVTFINEAPKTASIRIKKTDGNQKTLDGAEFSVYHKEKDGTLTEIGVIVTDADGVSSVISGLIVGETYVIKEAKAPDGYTVNAEDTEYTVETNDAGKAVDVTIQDNAIVVLPNTGGSGIRTYILISCFFASALLAFSVIAGKKRKRAT